MNLPGKAGSELTETGFDAFAKISYQQALRRMMGPFAVLATGGLLLAAAGLVEQVFGHVVRVAGIGVAHAALGQVQRQAAPAGLLRLGPGVDIQLDRPAVKPAALAGATAVIPPPVSRLHRGMRVLWHTATGNESST